MQASLWQLSAGLTGATGRTWGARLIAGYATALALSSAAVMAIIAARPSTRSVADAVALRAFGAITALTALAVAPSLAREIGTPDPALAALARLRGQLAHRVAAVRFVAGMRRFAWLLATRGGPLVLFGLAVAGAPYGQRALQLVAALAWTVGVTLSVAVSSWAASVVGSARAGRWWFALWVVPEALRHLDDAVPSAWHAWVVALDAVIALGATQ